MQRTFTIALISGILLSLALGGIFFYTHFLAKDTLTITLTENGFEPESIDITVGDTVRFVSSVERQFWPASDAHPSHGIFPDFDPQKPIRPGEYWEFTFEKLGSWNYHDHLSSQFTGTINVYSRFGQSTSDCLDRDHTGLQEDCWIEEFKLAHQENGFDGVFALFESYQNNDELFTRNCHDIMHLIGDFAYEEYAQKQEVFDQPQTSYCAFGFYHGFIERMITETGDHTLSRQYCEKLRSEGDFPSEQIAADAEGACVHGFGHAIFDSLDGSFWGDAYAMVDEGIKVCEDVFDGDFYESECGTGIWNALANAYTSQSYYLSFNEDELPFGVCRRTRDIYKPGCYVEMMVQFGSWNNLSHEQTLKIINNIIEPIAREKVYFSYIADAVQWKIPYDYKGIADFADSCSEYGMDVFEDCQIGIHYGILKLTTPFENMEESKKVCAEYEDAQKQQVCEELIPNKLF